MNFVEHRLNTCNACELARPLAPGFRICTSCNCMLELKVLNPWASCPENRWQRANLTETERLDIIINDAYMSQSSNSTYAQHVRRQFAESFPGQDLAELYADLVRRRTSSN